MSISFDMPLTLRKIDFGWAGEGGYYPKSLKMVMEKIFQCFIIGHRELVVES